MNIFASTDEPNKVSLSYAVFGFDGTNNIQIGGSYSNSQDITDNATAEYTISLTFSYQDISIYSYLYIQLYYTTANVGANKHLYLAYQSASAYSHIHTTFGINSLINGVTAINTAGYTNGATLTNSYYLQLGQATTTNPGLITTTGQTFAGDKYFGGSVGVSGVLSVANSSSVSTSYLDYSSTGTTYASLATVNFSNFSGMILVNNTSSTGNVELWLCGGQSATKLGDSSGNTASNGTIEYVAGITGYRWTNTTGGSISSSFGVVRTRTIG
jgi:hypothetical protein